MHWCVERCNRLEWRRNNGKRSRVDLQAECEEWGLVQAEAGLHWWIGGSDGCACHWWIFRCWFAVTHDVTFPLCSCCACTAQRTSDHISLILPCTWFHLSLCDVCLVVCKHCSNASTKRNIHPFTPILIINNPLSVSSIYCDPLHPLCWIYVPASLLAQSLSKFSLVYLLISQPLCLQCFDAVGWVQEGHPTCKKTEWWDAGMVICLGQGPHLHMAQLMLLPLTVSCSSKSRFILPSWFYLSCQLSSLRFFEGHGPVYGMVHRKKTG